MKKHFPGYYSPTTREIKALWDTCIFAVDANILLNLYRYSDVTRKAFLSLLDSIKTRLWLPHRAAEEYFEDRLGVISQQEKAYDDTDKSLRDIQKDLKSARQHPFISDKTMAKLESVLEKVSNELADNKIKHSKRVANDDIKEALTKIFNKRIGEPYSKDDLIKICTEGETRYSEKTPPGFKDDGKSDGSGSLANNRRRFGDYIIWRQLIDKATEDKKGIIFISDDKKEDWWSIIKGQTIGPRPELVMEFSEKTSKKFHLYKPDRFIEFASKHFKQKVTSESVDEIRDLRQRNIQTKRKIQLDRDNLRDAYTKRGRVQNQLNHLHTSFAALSNKRNDLVHQQSYFSKFVSNDGQDDSALLDRYIDLTKQIDRISEEKAAIKTKIRSIEMEYDLVSKLNLIDIEE